MGISLYFNISKLLRLWPCSCTSSELRKLHLFQLFFPKLYAQSKPFISSKDLLIYNQFIALLTYHEVVLKAASITSIFEPLCTGVRKKRLSSLHRPHWLTLKLTETNTETSYKIFWVCTVFSTKSNCWRTLHIPSMASRPSWSLVKNAKYSPKWRKWQQLP